MYHLRTEDDTNILFVLRDDRAISPISYSCGGVLLAIVFAEIWRLLLGALLLRPMPDGWQFSRSSKVERLIGGGL